MCRPWTSRCASGNARSQLPKNSTQSCLPAPRTPPGASKTTLSESTCANPSISCALNVAVPVSNASRTLVVMRSSSRCVRPQDRAAEGGLLAGGHPGFFGCEHPGGFAAASDCELVVGAREVTLDCLERHVQLVGDLAVGTAVCGEPHDAQLGGRQCLETGAPRASRPGAGGLQLFAGASRERARRA